MNKQLLMMAMGLMIATTVNAQEEPKVPQEEEDKLKSGAAIPDFRVGVSFSYDKWKAKIDVGYAYGKIGMKDVIVEYGFNKKNFLRGGYFIHQYGFQSSTSSSFKETMEEPQSNAAFNNDRTLGLMYEHNGDKFLGTFQLHRRDRCHEADHGCDRQ